MVGLSIRVLLVVLCLTAVPGARAYAPSLLDWKWMEQASREDVAGLLDRGADIDARTGHGDAPLHEAARSNENPAVAALLLGRGTDIEARTKFGETPLHEAARSNENPAVAALLLDRGADPSLRGAEGRFPADRAEDNDAIGGTGIHRRLNDGRF